MKKMIWLIVLALLVGNLFAGMALSSYTVSPTTVRPGSNGVISLTISNPSTSTAVGNKVYSISLSVYPPGSISTTSSKISVGDLDISSSTVVSIPFSVKSNAPAGVYIVEIRATGYTATGTESVSLATQSNYQATTIPISVVNSPILSISSDKEVVGDIEPITLSITNNGGVANRVRISMNSTDFALLGQDEAFIEAIEKGGKVNLVLDSRSADDGANDVYFTFKYDDELGNSVVEKKSVRLTVKKEKLDLKFIQKSDVVTREDSTLKLTVENTGKQLNDVRVSFGSDSITLKDASEFKLGNIAQDGKIEISLPVFTTLSPGTNYVEFNVKYTDKEVEKEQTISVPITITSDADVSVYLDAKPAPLAVGQEHTISVLVSNLGSYEISNVDVGMSSPAFESLDVHEREYIGGLDKDDFSSVQFKIKVIATQAGEYPLNVSVKYRDTSGEWKSKEIVDTLTIHSSQSSNGSLFGYLLFGAIAIIIAVWYFKFRKKPKA
jgi:hypothetical protein